MRPGYLDVVASRALGVAPVLRPATPSRFEPDQPQAGAAQVDEIVAAPGRLPGMGRPARRNGEPSSTPSFGSDVPDWEEQREVGQPELPNRLGPARHGPSPRRLAEGEDLVGALGLTEEPTSPSAAGRRDERAPDTRPDRTTGRLAKPGDSIAVPVIRADSSEANETVATQPRILEPADGDRPAFQLEVRSGGTAPAAGDETTVTRPTIAVRIGRIDVRAVHPAPSVVVARPPRPSRPSAGPSLADHLRARDRGRR